MAAADRRGNERLMFPAGSCGITQRKAGQPVETRPLRANQKQREGKRSSGGKSGEAEKDDPLSGNGSGRFWGFPKS